MKNNTRNKASKNTIRIVLAVIAAAIFVVLCKLETVFNPAFDPSQDFIKFIDVGQGDSILIYSNGYSALIDTGLADAGNDICSVLDECGIKKLNVLMLTHLDYDHTGGSDRITEIFEVENLILPQLSVESEGLIRAELVLNRIVDAGGEVMQAEQGMNFRIGEFEITVLAALENMSSENNRSIVTMAEIGDIRFLLAGDIESKAEKEILAEGLDINCDVLKVAHHGSNSSSSEAFLKAAKPQYAVISVGADNQYGHPHNEVLSTFEYFNAKVLRTDRFGDITFYVDDGELSYKTER